MEFIQQRIIHNDKRGVATWVYICVQSSYVEVERFNFSMYERMKLLDYNRVKSMCHDYVSVCDGMKIWVPVNTTILYTDKGPIALSDATDEQKEDYKLGLINSKKVISYKVGTVFDIGQTDYPKEKYPELYTMGYSSEELAMISDGLVNFSRSLGCPIYFENLPTITERGYYATESKKIVINSKLEDTQRLSTISHEIGHFLQNHRERKDMSGSQREFEADCISILIQTHFGIELTDTRKSHLAHHYKEFEKELESENHDITNEDKIKHIEEVMSNSVSVFRKYVDQMDEFIKVELDNTPVPLNLNCNPIMTFTYEVNECQEFPIMGDVYSNIESADKAMEIFNNIPDSRKSLVAGINLVGKIATGETMEVIPICSGNEIDLGMLEYYPALKENPEADRKAKELVDISRENGFQTFGTYNFTYDGNNAALSGHRRNR